MTAQLRTEWKTDDQYKSEVGKAYKAAVGYVGDDADYIIKTYGNDLKGHSDVEPSRRRNGRG